MSSEQKKPNIGPITKLSTFISRYPNEKLHSQFKILEESFPSHRIIKGDGNCFYRAFAFLYLASHGLESYQATFPKVQWSYLKDEARVWSDGEFQGEMEAIWSKFVGPLAAVKSKKEREKKLQVLFNDMPHFDELIIGYFRSANHQHLLTEKQTFMPYMKNEADFQNELTKVATFGHESQGVQIFSLCHVMKVKITIFYVDQSNFQPIEFMENLEDKGLFLFYRPGHYDIVYPFELGEEEPAHQQKGIWHNFKASFRNKPKIVTSEIVREKKKEPEDSKVRNEERMGSKKFTGSGLLSDTTIDFGQKQKLNQRSSMKAERTSAYFRSNDQSYTGKYDLRYTSSVDREIGQKGYTSPNNPQKDPQPPKTAKRNPVVIASWTDPFQRLSMQALAVGGISLLGYLLYNQFYR